MNNYPREIWFTTTAKGSKRAWYYSRAAFRAMPVALKVAELEIATGVATECAKPSFVG